MKDKPFILYMMKETGQRKPKYKNIACFHVPYADCQLTTYIYFEKDNAYRIDYDVEEIYKRYGTDFGSVSNFTRMIADKYSWLEFDPEDEDEVHCNVGNYHLDDVLSQVLANISVMLNILNEVLGINAKVIYESDWREMYCDYLESLQKKHSKFTTISIVALVASVVGCIVFENMKIDGLILLCMLLAPISLISTLVNLFLKKFYYKKFIKAKKNKF